MQTFGRFPERNRVLHRPYTKHEAESMGVEVAELNASLGIEQQPVEKHTLGRLRLFHKHATKT